MNSHRFSKISIHPLFWLMIAAGILTGHLWETVIAFTVVFIHELGHALVAQWFGWDVTEIELLPFGGVAKIDSHNEHPFHEECLVLIAGPLQNLWLPLLSFGLLNFSFWGEAQHQIFLAQNNALLLFNLLPIWPLDGGRLLHVFLDMVYPYKSAYKRVLYFSTAALFVFGLLVCWHYPFSVNLWMVVIFILFAIYKERRLLPLRLLRFLLAVSSRKNVYPRFKNLTVTKGTTFAEIFTLFYRNAEHHIRIKDRNDPPIDGKRLANAYFNGTLEGDTIGDYR
ncbi:M50 family metallopeptidase [Sporolactobacillus kofuensis]|uniref:M50 family metallopeptidase n=1 Tax=Sporolactobacillus kofuensis TaxID=269672 RepID=A0ABW1WCU9_9BACL|nr:site-2 protease family protein [Sporolactobacillus kofuensis]MCO7175586.1 site-2 protease family protein [Sporolactobacillus kofuensis]